MFKNIPADNKIVRFVSLRRLNVTDDSLGVSVIIQLLGRDVKTSDRNIGREGKVIAICSTAF